MRMTWTVVGMLVGLALAGKVSAQAPVSFFPNIGPVQNQIVDTRNAALPIAQPMYVQSAWTRFASMFPSGLGRIPARPSAAGGSIFPTPNQMPNADYLRAFQFYRANQASSSTSLWPFGQ